MKERFYLFVFMSHSLHLLKATPNRVNVLRYTINSTNCTILEWDQPAYGTYSPTLKYQLSFIKNDGEKIKIKTTNQTTFSDCHDQNIFNSYMVSITAIDQDLIGKPSRYIPRDSAETVRLPEAPSTATQPQTLHLTWVNIGLGAMLFVSIVFNVIICCLWERKSSKNYNVNARKMHSMGNDDEQRSLSFDEETQNHENTPPSLYEIPRERGLYTQVDANAFNVTYQKIVKTEEKLLANYYQNVDPNATYESPRSFIIRK